MKLSLRISKLKNSAKHRGIPVRLMDYEYENLLRLGCHYCGKSVLEETGVCLDRVDSNKGYTLHNVVPCCKRCNMAKNDMTFPEFITWIESAYTHTQKMLELAKNNYKEYSYKEEKEMHKLVSFNEIKTCIKVIGEL